MDCSLPVSSVHGILQARILNGLPCFSPGDLPHPEAEPTSLKSPALAGGFFTASITWEALSLSGPPIVDIQCSLSVIALLPLLPSPAQYNPQSFTHTCIFFLDANWFISVYCDKNFCLFV